MDEQRRGRRNLAQNLLITLLTLTAAALFTQTQLYSMGVDRGASALGGAAQTAGAAEPGELAAPVRVAVTGSYGRYGSAAMTTGDREFADPLGRCLAEALGSARDYAECTEAEFLAALEAPSIYYDFLSPLPLPVLSMLTGGGAAEESISARRLILSGVGGGVSLYLWDGGEIYLRAGTAASRESLQQTAGEYEQGGAVFALDFGADLAPCSLLPKEPPELPMLTAGDALPDTNGLLTAIGFNPRVRTRYLESNGTELIADGSQTLRIRPDRTVFYNRGGDGSLKIEASGETPSLEEAVLGTAKLLNGLLSPGEASLYLQEVRENGKNLVLRFGCQMQGVPVRYADGGCAAEATLSGRSVEALTLRFRQYASTGETALLLPLKQALAVASQTPGVELAVGYVDSGTECAPHWLAD